MPAQHEVRRYPRMSISGGEYGIRFRVKGEEVQDSRLVNLSAGGCGMEVAMADAGPIDAGDLLEDLYLDHPDLPLVPLSALVIRILGKVAGKTQGYVLVGVEFQEMTTFVRNLIADHVAAQLAGE